MSTNVTPVPALLLVMLGGAVGAGARHLFGMAAMQTLGFDLPWGTFGVNLIGGLLMGLLVTLIGGHSASEALRLALAVGVLGGFTTFSAFSLELYTMILRGEVALGMAYAMASVAGAVMALWAGILLGRLAT